MTFNSYRETRRKAGFRTQAELAEHIEVSSRSIADWERGATRYPKWLSLYLAALIREREAGSVAASDQA